MGEAKRRARSDLQKAEQVLDAISESLNGLFLDAFGKKIEFCLTMWEANKPRYVNYVANADKGIVVEALRATADQLEANEDMPRTMGEA